MNQAVICNILIINIRKIYFWFKRGASSVPRLKVLILQPACRSCSLPSVSAPGMCSFSNFRSPGFLQSPKSTETLFSARFAYLTPVPVLLFLGVRQIGPSISPAFNQRFRHQPTRTHCFRCPCGSDAKGALFRNRS